MAPLAWNQALIQAMRSSKHLKTQTALARRSGVAQTTIGRILRGEVDPQSGNLHRLARALGMRLTELARVAEDAEGQTGPATVSEPAGGHAVFLTEEIRLTLHEALACWEECKRGEQALESLRRKENDAVERLQKLVRVKGKDGSLT